MRATAGQGRGVSRWIRKPAARSGDAAFTTTRSATGSGLEGLWVSMDSNSNNLGFGNGIIGVSNTGAPIRSNVFTPSASSDNEFFVARVGINYKFGSY